MTPCSVKLRHPEILDAPAQVGFILLFLLSQELDKPVGRADIAELNRGLRSLEVARRAQLERDRQRKWSLGVLKTYGFHYKGLLQGIQAAESPRHYSMHANPGGEPVESSVQKTLGMMPF